MSNDEAIANVATNVAQVSSHTYHIEKLNDQNYQPWRRTMEIILEQYNLLNIIGRTCVCPDIHVEIQAQHWARKLVRRLGA